MQSILVLATLAVLATFASAFMPSISWQASRATRPSALQPLFKTGKIHEASIVGDAAAVAAMLDEDPKLISARDIEGMAPLHYAARNGYLEFGLMLLARGADVNQKNDKLRTPLQLACSYSDGKYGPEFKELAIAMIKTGKGDINLIQRNDKMTALDYAKRAKWDKELKALWIEHGSFSLGEGVEKSPGPGGFPVDDRAI